MCFSKEPWTDDRKFEYKCECGYCEEYTPVTNQTTMQVGLRGEADLYIVEEDDLLTWVFCDTPLKEGEEVIFECDTFKFVLVKDFFLDDGYNEFPVGEFPDKYPGGGLGNAFDNDPSNPDSENYMGVRW